MTEQQLMEMDDRIDAFLSGQMTWEEEQKFLSDCRNDTELKERAYMTALLAKTFKCKSLEEYQHQLDMADDYASREL